MLRSAIVIAGRPLDLLPVKDGVQPSGGGRALAEVATIAGTLIRTQGVRTSRRLRVQSPGGNARFVISEADAQFLLALHAAGAPFTLSLSGDYDFEGTFAGCLFDGDALFRKTRTPGFREYDFTIAIPQGAP